ncbi:hypothetical protein N1028_02090 [Herbiconiux sp. CPCC 203407]|uniref:Uncharacterized protein n=1 Tax=Herbiconiux oxytropis TaxID=2970915 RepID=A0AA41XEB9_9MICO|nr:hypothetical protein [Herbiconiux oxytropis]MCS5721028.1 hypothetical protein [Herbiconiux oxytropis]MCS5724680.1 hypothetical protein [Herbiconiux oxytropis]
MDRITFAVSDVAPDADIGPVVLGIDLLAGESGDALTFLARFDRTGFSACTTSGDALTALHGACVAYSDGAVSVTARLPVQRDRSGRSPVAFCIIDGVPIQTGIPVVIVPSIAT